MPEIKVKKKDGRFEDFDRNKVLGGIIKSGASPEQGEMITSQVKTWMPGAAVNGLIRSSEIRAKVLELLRPVNPRAAATFETYKKPSQ